MTPCPECQRHLEREGNQLVCSNPRCDHSERVPTVEDAKKMLAESPGKKWSERKAR